MPKTTAAASGKKVKQAKGSLADYVASLNRYECEAAPKPAALEALEKKLGGRFPEVIRQVFLKYGGLSFWYENMSFSDLKDTAKQAKDFPVWSKDYLPIFRDGDTMHLVRKSDSTQDDPAVHYYEFNSGMKGPAVLTKSFTEYVKRGAGLRKQYFDDNPDEQDELGSP